MKGSRDFREENIAWSLRYFCISCLSLAEDIRSTIYSFFVLHLMQNVLCSCRPSLKILSLGCCSRACCLALRQVAERTTLQELSLDLCPFLSDASVEAIFARCRDLKSLVLVVNESLTVETIRALARSGSKVFLHVKECPGIKPESVSEEADGANVQVQEQLDYTL